MQSRSYEKITNISKEHQKKSRTGAIWYSLNWLFAREETIVYDNPNFKSVGDVCFLDKVAIYCLHGTADYPTAFEKIKTGLLEKKLPSWIASIHLISLEEESIEKKSIQHDIVSYAKRLMERISQNGHKQVILIGHSRGGLINAYATEHYAADFNIEVLSIMSICSPFKGSFFAKTWFGYFSKTIPQMSPGAVFLEALNRDISNSNKKYYFFSAKKDWVVHYQSTKCDGYTEKNPHSHYIYEEEGHLSVLSSTELVNHLYDLITQIEIPLLSTSMASKTEEAARVSMVLR